VFGDLAMMFFLGLFLDFDFDALLFLLGAPTCGFLFC